MDLAIETKPFGYYNKPFNSKEIYAIIQLAKSNFNKKFLFIKDIQHEVKIFIDDIKYVKSDGNYLEIVTKTKKHLIRSTINSFIQLPPTENFHHVHRSYIINLKAINKIDGNFLYINNIAIPYSKNKIDIIKLKIFS